MHIRFMGAAQTVTGSCYIIEAAGRRFAVDCGMYQGNARMEERNRKTGSYGADKLEFILLTHAHIDHSGLLPRLVKEGFKGRVYCTEPTVDLLGIMLLDSAHIQEMEAEWASRKRARRGGEPVEPLYSTDDARAAVRLLVPTEYGKCLDFGPGITACFHDAGHILGSSFLELTVRENGSTTRLVFSGDLGRPDSLIVDRPDTPQIEPVDYLFLESTYGDRDHKNESNSLDELAEAVHFAIRHGEKTIIPAFAVERTQEIIYSLHLLQNDGKIPRDLPVYVDSPLAIRATEIFRRHKKYTDQRTQDMIARGDDPLTLPGLAFTLETAQSQAINDARGPAVVISASGMCNAGRIKHHLRHNLWRKGASIVFVGFQGVGTPGRKIVDGAESISLLGEDIKVAAKIWTIGGFSAHAGQGQLLDWAAHFAHPNLNVLLVHGEEKAQTVLAGLLRERIAPASVRIPEYGQILELLPGKAPHMGEAAPAGVDFDTLMASLDKNTERLRAALSKAGRVRYETQTEIQEQIAELENRYLRLLADLEKSA